MDRGNTIPPMLRIVVAFTLGALSSWWLVRPTAVVPPASQARAESAVVEHVTADTSPDPAVGIPPESATLPRSHPSAGQRRALTRALDEIARAGTPSNTAALPDDGETTARLAASLRAHLLMTQGVQP